MSKTADKEYQMTKKMFDELLKTRTEEEKKMNPYEFVATVVNHEFGVKGTVSRISFYN